MTVLYNLFIQLYLLAIKLFALINPKAKLWIEGRHNLLFKLKQQINKDDKIIWFHCASLGEFEQGRPLIEACKEKYKNYKILLTFYSPSGYEIRKNYKGADYIFYMPLDTKKNAENFIKIVNPVKAIFVKYEYWYHFINTLYSHSIPTYIVSAKFYPNQHFFKFYGFWFRKILRKITYFFVQDDESKTLLNSIGIVNIIISGDTRFDRVYDILNNKKNIPLIDKFKNKNQILIAGSTWLKDEVLIVNFINQNQNNNIKYIIVPHEINQDRIDFLIKEIKTKTIRYSNLNEDNIKEANVIIVDSIGLLSSLYQYGDIAYIGGGFGKGIHNILEPAVFGLPIIFGTNYFRFKEGKDLVRKKGAFVIHNQTEFNNTINSLISENEKMSQAGNICKEYVAENIGATNKILEYIYN